MVAFYATLDILVHKSLIPYEHNIMILHIVQHNTSGSKYPELKSNLFEEL